MKHVVVRYKVKPERIEEHEALVRSVFAQLAEVRPAGLDYQVFKLGDGVSFIHRASVSAAENPLTSLESFKAFTADIKSRCEEPPVSSESARVGSYP